MNGCEKKMACIHFSLHNKFEPRIELNVQCFRFPHKQKVDVSNLYGFHKYIMTKIQDKHTFCRKLKRLVNFHLKAVTNFCMTP